MSPFFDSADGRLTVKGHEQLAEAWRASFMALSNAAWFVLRSSCICGEFGFGPAGAFGNVVIDGRQ